MRGLTDFLLARIAEDEAQARYDAEWADATETAGWARRFLAECEAKRRIVEDATPLETASGDLREVVRLLATVYADHADWREEWRP